MLRGADSLWINEEAMAQFLRCFEPLEPDEDHVVVNGGSRGAQPAGRNEARP